MALYVEPAILQTYSCFYTFALEKVKTPPALPCVTLDCLDAAALESALKTADKDAKTIILRGCKTLQNIDFFACFKEVSAVCICNCSKITALWDVSKTPLLTMLAITDCPALKDITTLQNAPQLEHFLLNSKGFLMPRLDSLDPLKSLRNIITMDLSCKRPRFSCELPYAGLFPRLEALTITPQLTKYFVKDTPR